MQTLLVASRKGLFVVRGQGAQWAIASHHFAPWPRTTNSPLRLATNKVCMNEIGRAHV